MNLDLRPENQPENRVKVDQIAAKGSLASLYLSFSSRFSSLRAMSLPNHEDNKGLNIDLTQPKSNYSQTPLSFAIDLTSTVFEAALIPGKLIYSAAKSATQYIGEILNSVFYGKFTTANTQIEDRSHSSSFSTSSTIFGWLLNLFTKESHYKDNLEAEKEAKKRKDDDIGTNGPIRDRSRFLLSLIGDSVPQVGITLPISPGKIREAIINGQITPLDRDKLKLDSLCEPMADLAVATNCKTKI